MVAFVAIFCIAAGQSTWAAETDEIDRKTHSFTSPTKGHEDNPPAEAWDHLLPFYGKKLTLKGYHLPQPVGVTLIATYVEQDLTLQNLRISGDGINFNPVPFVAFEGASSKATAVDVKLDAWILPFLNVFGIVGVIDGQGHIPIQINIDGLLDAIGSDLCKKVIKPGFCGQTANIEADPKYQGYNYGGGIVLAGGYKSFFVAVPITYVKSDLDIVANEITSLEAEILLGYSFKLKNGKSAEVFIGASYLDVDYQATGFEPLSEINPILPDIYFEMDAENTDKWNNIVGGQYALSDEWQLQFQVGFGGSRSQGTFTGTFRF
jgi:hypothetical protein